MTVNVMHVILTHAPHFTKIRFSDFPDFQSFSTFSNRKLNNKQTTGNWKKLAFGSVHAMNYRLLLA